MSSAKDDIGNAMDRLQKQLVAAEKQLRRFPGSRHESASVYLWETPGDHSKEVYLEFGELRDDQKQLECLKVVEYCDGEEYEGYSVHSLPVSKRIEVAKNVPDLLSLARAANKKVVAEASEAADAIEQALASGL